MAILVLGTTRTGAAAPPPNPDRFLNAVRAFGRTLHNDYARARPGARVGEPQRGVWPMEIRLDQPVASRGSSNLLYEAATLQLMRVLSEVIDDGAHRLAANGYVDDFLAHGQSPHTGLLAWGPALSLRLEDGQVPGDASTAGHELLPLSTPWDVLWDSNPQATTKAIAGLEYHFPRPDDARFADRGPFFNAQRPTSAAPSCEQVGLMAHAFAFLYRKTGDRRWLSRARDCVTFAWERRDATTRLVPQRFVIPPPPVEDDEAVAAAAPIPLESGVRQALLGYFLLKAWKEVPHEAVWGQYGVALIASYDRHTYTPASGNWNAAVRVDGLSVEVPAGEKTAGRQLPVWGDPAEGFVPVAELGRTAAYAAGVTADPQCLEIARRALTLVQKTTRPADASTYPLAFALGLSLDLYDLTQDKKYLDYAQRLGDVALAHYWNGRLFRSRPGSNLYNARLGAGDLAVALLRLHLRLHRFGAPRQFDWTF